PLSSVANRPYAVERRRTIMRRKRVENRPTPSRRRPNPDADLNGTDKDSLNSPLNRRTFLAAVGGATAAAISGVGSAAVSAAEPPFQINDVSAQGALAQANRMKKSFKYRTDAANIARNRDLVTQQNNGDEDRYTNKIGSYTKALPHNQLGEVDLGAYATLAKAIQTQNPADFEAIELALGRKLTIP